MMTFHNKLDQYCNHIVGVDTTPEEALYKSIDDMDADQRELHPEGVMCDALICVLCLHVTTPCTITEECRHYAHSRPIL